MSTAVTKEEFIALEKTVTTVLQKLEELNATLARLVTAIEVNNNKMCNYDEKIASLQDSRTDFYKLIKDLADRILIVETTSKLAKDNFARTLSIISFIVMLIGFLLKMAKVW